MTTNYVSPTGTATWANSENSGTPCSLATANTNADDDDVVVLAGGTYSTGIVPTNSGSAGHPITYTVASGATSIISASRGLDLRNGQDYITVQVGDGAALNFRSNSFRAIDAVNADRLVLDGVDVRGIAGTSDSRPVAFALCDYPTIKNCTFNWDDTADKYADLVQFQACTHLDIGPSNVFGNAPHASVYIRRDCRYGRVHSNTFQNAYRHGLNIEDSLTYTGQAGNNPEDILVESNFFDRCGRLSNSNPWSTDRGRSAAALEHTANRCVVRHNIFFKTDITVIWFDAYRSLSDNRFYHNLIYRPQDYGSRDQTISGCGVSCEYSYAINRNWHDNNIIYDPLGIYTVNFIDQGGGSISGNLFRNNIFYDSAGFRIRYGGSSFTSLAAAESGMPTAFSGNINSDPLLVDPENNNYDLGALSLAVGGARFLATVASKNSNTLTLGDYEAYFFVPDSWDIPNFSGDTIYNQDGDSATVTARPAHNQITLDDATDFAASDTLTTTAFTGSAPDIGPTTTVIDDPVTTGDTEYVGWTTSSGEPATDPTSDITIAGDRTYLRKWTATEDGAAYSVRFYVAADGWAPTAGWVVVYKMMAGIALQLQGFAPILEPLTADAWTREFLLTAVDGRSLDFLASDDLYYGVAMDDGTGNTSVGREEEDGDGLYWSDFAFTDGVHYDLGVDYIELVAGRDMAFVLGYNPPAVDALGPEIFFLTPADDPHAATAGANEISLLGTTSDPSGVALVTWADDHGNAGVAVGDRSWSIPNVPLAAGATEIIVTALDGLGNSNSESLVVNFTPPVDSEIVGWEDVYSDSSGNSSGSDNTDNPPDDVPSARTLNADRTYLIAAQEMTAAGTVAGVYFYVGATWNPIHAWAVVYKVVGANTVLIGKALINGVAHSSWNFVPITAAESEQSLIFASGDYLSAGCAYDLSAENTCSCGVNATGGGGLVYSRDTLSSAPVASFVTANLLTASGEDPAFSLVFVPISVDTTLPELLITSHPEVFDAGTTATITLKGRASDPAGISSVTWTTDLGGSGTATTNVASATTADWEITSAALVAGTTVFTITVTDGAGNETSRTVSVTRYESSDLRLPAIYDGNTASPAIAYSSLTSPGSWEWIQYAFKLTDIIDQVLLWSPNSMSMVVALSMDGTSWDYYAGDTEHALVPDSANYPRLVAYSTLEDAVANYVGMSGGGCYSMPLRNGTVAQYARVHFWVPESPGEVVINELRVERQVVAEQIRTLSLGAISADIGTVSAGVLYSQNLGASSGILMDLNQGIQYVGGSTARKIELNGQQGSVTVREGGWLTVGDQNVVIESNDLGGTQGRIVVAPNGGRAGKDYVLLDEGNVYKMVYLAGVHRKYSFLSRSEGPIEVFNIPQTGVTVQVPGYWRKLPKITAQASNFISYNATYPDQTQRVICRAENTRWRSTPAAGQVDFTARAHSEIYAASVFGAGAVSGAVNRIPTTTSDFPAQTISVASVNANCQRVELTYEHAACSGFIWWGPGGTSVILQRSYAVQRTLTCQIYYSAAWHTIASDTYNEFTDWNDRIVRSVNSGWVGANISAYRVVMSAGVVSQTTWQGNDDIQYLNFTRRVEYLSNTLGAIAGSMVYVAVE